MNNMPLPAEGIRKLCCITAFCFFMFSSLTAYGDDSTSDIKLKFLQELHFEAENDKQQMLGISSMRFLPSLDPSKGRLILLSDDTGAVENIYGLSDTPHTFEVNIECNNDVDGEACQYQEPYTRDDINYPPSFIEAGLNESQIDNNTLWCSLFYIGSFFIDSSPTCKPDIEGIELLADEEKLVMEEQVVGVTYGTPAVLLLDTQNLVTNKYSFPFSTFGFERNSRNQNIRKSGVRPNGGFEGIALLPGEKGLYAAVTEFPLKQDAQLNRFVLFSLEDGPNRHEDKVMIREHYYYNVDKVLPDYLGVVKAGYPKTGVSDILAIDNEHRSFITIERTAIRYTNHGIRSINKLFRISLPDSSDQPLASSLPILSVIKEEIPIDVDVMNDSNIEGLTWGPELANGNKTLIMVNDNDAGSAEQLTQLFIFEVLTH
ncbi:MAG: esterase-like activity of phytase family protein [Candidatus Endonucleobacter bathymodioli]|uniref:Esterase-like activity of phytase family protein n=1 Tax=Candidatus Endonucleibacter bathymodioli TaxID=539814 RepID=A0AA90SYE1_9GAMM|nr:esterase-like activity of phytase family protein [Candidatus Endonucleobacter bathymodioli]